MGTPKGKAAASKAKTPTANKKIAKAAPKKAAKAPAEEPATSGPLAADVVIEACKS
eukprot:CAMPEP_0198197728 /NCGR_PEP_ID=MMETSP1445-20131203/1278_1 /TAXON_ID=36898 /ORGANISM="Pyramimonas sp., Strain CCMP2087" /LENGTH=55 /DNA_ID=CAMNT_0043867081 /DNA_START=65 /DNA_END=232 /DNA_ORIENTATION=+